MKYDLAFEIQALQPPFMSFFLSTGTFVLGRSSTCHFVVKDDTVSRRHGEIIVADGCLSVRDLDSRNGTYVDERRVEKSIVQNGQRLRFGSVPFLLVNAARSDDDSSSETDTKKCGKAAPAVETGLVNADFSKAQYRVLNLLLGGLAEKQIARRLRISKHTVHNHIQAIHRILKVHSRTELLACFLRSGKR